MSKKTEEQNDGTQCLTSDAPCKALLAKTGLTMDAVMAQTLALKLDEIDEIDQMIASAEARRNAALRELRHHRKTFAERLDGATAAVEGTERAEGQAPTEPHRHHYG